MRRAVSLLCFVLLCSLPLASPVATERAGSAQAPAQAFDVLITGGRVLDGSGNPWFFADVGIRGDQIVAVGRLPGATAKRTIDAKGKVVTPGFIDIHIHAEGGLGSNDARLRAAPNMVAQGATTLVVNQCGRSPWPIAGQVEALEKLGIGTNAILLIGHGEIRGRVMGNDIRRPATAEEIARKRELVRQGMADGAWGISAGLEYVPGRWSEIDELVGMVQEIVPYGGVFMSHQRSEGSDPMWYWPSQDPPGPPNLLDAVLETIEIGERTGATVVAAHIKAKGANYFGTSHAALRLIERARARGVQIYADQYPYNTTGTDGNTTLIPSWVQEAGRRLSGQSDARINWADALQLVMKDPESSRMLRQDVTHEIARRGGPEQIVVFGYPDQSAVGKTLAELSAARGVSAYDMALLLQTEGEVTRRGGARLRGFSLSEYDIEVYARLPWTATASDAGITMPGESNVHARYYGTFPRKIREYALDRGVITVEHAVRSATSLPAQILGLRDRGLLKEGYRADIAVIDLDRIRDVGTFTEPHQYPEGIDYVMVNGKLVVDRGELTWELPGKVLTPRTDSRQFAVVGTH
jgi:N-acyl-D-amino-acid deacylase